MVGSTKYDRYRAIFKEMIQELPKLEHDSLVELVGFWEKGFIQTDEILAAKKPSIPRSKFTEGLEQGLRGLPMIFEELPPDVRPAAFAIFRRAVDAHDPEFFEADRQRLVRALKRGRISTDAEYDLVRIRHDEIEGEAGFEREVRELRSLLGGYEYRD